jgi:ribosomal protein S18 acetylase RimI-like enzyme
MLLATTVTAERELEDIIRLQRANLISGLSTTEWQDQGFVTVEHTMNMLRQMHDAAPSIIIKDGDKVIAYALAMPQECRQLVPALEPMFANFDQLVWKGQPLKEREFYVMGQICIDKAYRGQGLFDKLYHKHKEVYSPRYDSLITEVATRNTRSMRAHERVGFESINVYRDELDEWSVVGWDWR